MAEPKQRRTSRAEPLARPLCLKATGDFRCFHRHAVLLLFNARNHGVYGCRADASGDSRNLPIAHPALSPPKIRLSDLEKRGRGPNSFPAMGPRTADIDHP